MISQRKNLALDKGATFKQTFRYLNPEREPYDLSTFEGWFRIFERGTEEVLLLEVPLELDADGNMSVYIADEDTELLEVETRAYTLELEDEEGDIERLLYGQLQVRGATRV